MTKSRLGQPPTSGIDYRQRQLFASGESFEVPPGPCLIAAVGKRRDGGTRYWCTVHKADATAKYGKPAANCRASHIPPIHPDDILSLEVDKYRGGIALWGAVPAVYDTTRLPMDRGIHVHARLSPDAKKEMDRTFRAVRIVGQSLPKNGITISELEAIYYMTASVFGYDMKRVNCTYCGYSHLDRDWFSVHPHRRHLCAGCGRHFWDTEKAVGNPILAARDACGFSQQKTRRSRKTLNIRQADFEGGIQIWGSNPAFLWTSDRSEEEGIHVHAYRVPGNHPDPDETYGEVRIDGIRLSPSMVRVLMAQSAMPSLSRRVVSVDCPSCGKPHFSVQELAFTPVPFHLCRKCGAKFRVPGRMRKTVANPLIAILARLATFAPRPPQHHDLGLMPETL